MRGLEYLCIISYMLPEGIRSRLQMIGTFRESCNVTVLNTSKILLVIETVVAWVFIVEPY